LPQDNRKIKMKKTIFKILRAAAGFFRDSGLHKVIPFKRELYSWLFKFWPYGNVIEIQGSKMYLDVNSRDPLIKGIFQSYGFERIHEKATTNLFKKIVKNGNVVVDLGSNIGYFTLLAAKLVGQAGTVYSFEPEPKNFGYLKKNVEINNYKNVVAVQRAVSDKKGKIPLFVCSYDAGHHTINQYSGIEAYRRGRHSEKKSIDIEATTLDDFFQGKENSIDLIKLDVQGAEALALKGMDKILKTNNRLKMIVDFFPILLEKMGDSPKEFISRILNDYHFSVFVIPGDNSAPEGEMVRINSIDEIMRFRKKEADHVNLFLTRQI